MRKKLRNFGLARTHSLQRQLFDAGVKLHDWRDSVRDRNAEFPHMAAPLAPHCGNAVFPCDLAAVLRLALKKRSTLGALVAGLQAGQ